MILTSFKRHYRWLIILGLLLASFLVVTAKTPDRDIELVLSIEVGDDIEDFDDGADPFPKGQFVEYRIEVKNNNTNYAHNDVVVLMDTPDYMTYVPNSTFWSVTDAEDDIRTLLTDLGDENNSISPLEIGYEIFSLPPNESHYFFIQYQVDPTINSDPEYTLAWATASNKYTAVPILSNLIESKITGDPTSSIRVKVNTIPPEGQQVFTNTNITYSYTITNHGGETAKDLILTTYLPQYTECVSNCGAIIVGDIEPNGFHQEAMDVKVKTNLTGATEIKNTGYDLVGEGIEINNRTEIIHPLTITAPTVHGDFWIEIKQSPAIVFNSKDGLSARADGYDQTDTEYKVLHKGVQLSSEIYPSYNYGSNNYSDGSQWCRVSYWAPTNAFFYTYNATRKYQYCNSGQLNDCFPQFDFSPMDVQLTTEFPDAVPELIDITNPSSHLNNTFYSYPPAPQSVNTQVNRFMTKSNTPNEIFISNEVISRAIKNGTLGLVNGRVQITVTQDRWQFVRSPEYDQPCCHHNSCGDRRPAYKWKIVDTQPITLTADATTQISVLTSTAWLKTSGGHLGTNNVISADQISNHDYNTQDLSFTRFDGSKGGNANAQTLSSQYTPNDFVFNNGSFGDGLNSDYMIFANGGNQANFDSNKGGAWVQTNTAFQSKNEPSFLQKGDPYDRDDLPRNYNNDLFDREIYGEVRVDKLPNVITSNFDVGDDIIWKNTGDITLGKKGLEDTLILKGGQARIFTTGDVYINANLTYEDVLINEHNKITSVRIDARNIYIAPEVTDIEIMLLAREEFHSGESNKQLRILGDVIANKSFWERTPLLEDNPTEFNKPSEYIIEDYRKYIAPPPGDTQLPDQRSVWRQVNPATGESLDAY